MRSGYGLPGGGASFLSSLSETKRPCLRPFARMCILLPSYFSLHWRNDSTANRYCLCPTCQSMLHRCHGCEEDADDPACEGISARGSTHAVCTVTNRVVALLSEGGTGQCGRGRPLAAVCLSGPRGHSRRPLHPSG